MTSDNPTRDQELSSITARLSRSGSEAELEARVRSMIAKAQRDGLKIDKLKKLLIDNTSKLGESMKDDVASALQEELLAYRAAVESLDGVEEFPIYRVLQTEHVQPVQEIVAALHSQEIDTYLVGACLTGSYEYVNLMVTLTNLNRRCLRTLRDLTGIGNSLAQMAGGQGNAVSEDEIIFEKGDLAYDAGLVKLNELPECVVSWEGGSDPWEHLVEYKGVSILLTYTAEPDQIIFVADPLQCRVRLTKQEVE